MITNEEKAREIANNDNLYGEDPDENSKIEECYIAAMAMTKWKDEEIQDFKIMGLIIKCKKTGTAYSLGYFGMYRLRSKVAELFDAKLGELYDDTYKYHGDKRKNAEDVICHYANKHKPVSLKIWNFLWLPNTGAKITYGCCKEIYDGINGKCEDFVIGYAGQDNPFTWNQFIELLRECYDNKSDLVWE